jgi:ACS family sodium-dependent inorganic phosphate cotransporter
MISNLLCGSLLTAGFSAKDVLNGGVVIWSLFTLLTPLAAAAEWLPILMLTRALMGLGEGVAFPCFQNLMKSWIPAENRSRSLSLIYSGHQIGSVLSALLSPLIIKSTGVASLFYVYGLLGFVWLMVWEPRVKSFASLQKQSEEPRATLDQSSDEEDPLLVSKTLETIASKGGLSSLSNILPWQQFFSNRVFYALLVAHTTFGIGYSVFIAWLPSYYNSAFGMDLKQSSWLSIFPFLMMAIGTNASGWMADHLINGKILSVTMTRKSLQLVGNLGPGFCLLYLALAPQAGAIVEAVCILSLATFTLGCQAGGFASTHTDISTKHASSIFGITNAGASLGGLLATGLTGYILDSTGSWANVFLAMAAFNFISGATFFLMASSEPQFQ